MNRLDVGKKAIKKSARLLEKYFLNQEYNKGFQYTNLPKLGSGGKSNIGERSFNIIKKEIEKHFKEDTISSKLHKKEGSSKYEWIINPLIGTGNYANLIPTYAASIVVCKNSKPIISVMSFPIFKTLVYMNESGRVFSKGKLKPSLSQSEDFWADLPSEFGNKEKSKELSKILQRISSGARCLDASGFSLGRIMFGGLGAYVHFNSITYDVLAGATIIKALGGALTDFQGKEWGANSRDVIISSNSKIHKKILVLIKKSRVLK